MRLNLWLSANDCGDGSITVQLNNSKQEALDSINQTEESIANGCFYDNGLIEEVHIEVEEGKLVEPFYINIE